MEDRLENVSGIGKATAERMKAAGIDTVQKLASLKPEDLVKLKIKGIGKATAEKYINSAKELNEELEQQGIKVKTQKIELNKADAITKEESLVKTKPSKDTTKIKDLIKRQAECNIGLVGHVDHGMIMSLRHFP